MHNKEVSRESKATKVLADWSMSAAADSSSHNKTCLSGKNP